ncbi:Longin-like domain-containing protein [Xylariomycetidae sp. FL0641]|nr:Longin-like domain-containing protein [Xylariomycetidae sp. FL0641]
MASTIPSIACIGVIGRHNNPLHITIFPSYDAASNTRGAPIRTALQFSLLLSSTLDVFETRARAPLPPLSGDYGLLHAVDERLACYGFETNTGVKFVAVIDMRGRKASASTTTTTTGGDHGGAGAGAAAATGLREGELKVVFRALQTAYVKLLQNPFYDPEQLPAGGGGRRITSRKFAGDVRRIGDAWAPGVTNL